MRKVGLALIFISIVLFAVMLFVPWFPLSIAKKSVAVTGLLIAAELAWWIGVLLIGKEVWVKVSNKIHPRNWFRRM